MISPLIELLNLRQLAKGISEEQVLEVAHLSYERSHEVIVMKGYRFHRAKLIAALAIGNLSFRLSEDQLPGLEALLEIRNELRTMLTSSLQIFRTAAAAAIADLCRSSISFSQATAEVTSFSCEGIYVVSAGHLDSCCQLVCVIRQSGDCNGVRMQLFGRREGRAASAQLFGPRHLRNRL